MKIGNFVTYTLIFCIAWLGLALWGWGSAQALSNTLLLPWVLPFIKIWPSTIALAMGGAVATLGAFVAAVVLLAVLFALEAIWHRWLTPSTTLPS